MKGNSLKRLIKKHFSKSDFAQNALTMLSGTAIAQAIPILCSPILTRLYSPKEYGTFGLFLSIITILGMTGTAKYELAILLPKREEDATNLTRLSLYLVSIFSLSSLIILIPFNNQIASLFGNQELRSFLMFTPIGIAILGYFNIFNYWSTRQGFFYRMAGGKIQRSTTNSFFSIGFGIINFGSIGLVVGSLLGQLIEVTYIGYNFFKKKSLFVTGSFAQIKSIAKRYKKFPQYSLGSAILNMTSLQLPVIILSLFFNSSAVGLFFHAHKVLNLPMSVVGSSLGQVFFQEISKKKNDRSFVSNLTYATFKKLLFIGVVPLSVIFVFGDLIFAFVFGKEWAESGYLAQLLSPWLLMVFIFSPISTLTSVFERQEVALTVNITILLARFAALYFASLYYQELGPVIEIFGLVSFTIWFFFGMYLLKLAGVNMKKSLITMHFTCVPLVFLLIAIRYFLDLY